MRKSIFLALALSTLLTSTAFADPSLLEKDKAQIESDKHVLAIDRDKLDQASKQLQHDRARMTDDEHRLEMDKQSSAGGKQHFWDKKTSAQPAQKAVPAHAQPQVAPSPAGQ